MSDPPLNATAGGLLGFLNRQPLTGWELVHIARRELCDFWNVSQSQVYRELARLADRALVEAGEPGVRDRVRYSITDAGRTEYLEWLHRDPPAENYRSPLHLKLTFADDLDDETLERFLRIHRRRIEARLDEYRQLEREIPTDEANAKRMVNAGILHRQAQLDWLDSLPWSAPSSE